MENSIKTLSVEEIQNIENVIGYTFNKKNLLAQAFIRSSFVNENKGFEDNEMLEFLGDRSLDMAVTKQLIDIYGEINDSCFKINNYTCFWESKEAFFSSIKKQLVQKETLSRRIDDLDLAKYLIMGKGDSVNTSIKEDLFEAIIGAITLDANWNFDQVFPIAIKMLNFDAELKEALDGETLSGLIDKFYTWYQKHFNCLPEFEYDDNSIPGYTSDGDFYCRLVISNENEQLDFDAQGSSKKNARNEVIRRFCNALFDEGYQYNLFPEDIKKDCPEKWLNVTEDTAINILQELEQSHFIVNVAYEFENVGNDKNGNPLWKCKGSFCINEEIYFKHKTTDICEAGNFLNKKDAKKHVAFSLVQSFLEHKHYIKR